MRSRCHHFRTAAGGAPISDAIASREGQSSITERNDLCVMDGNIGQIVLTCKPKVSHDSSKTLAHDCPMADDTAKSAYKARFIARVRWARAARSMTQAEMAELLGIKQDKYKQYETRSYLPHDLVPRFILAAGIDWAWLFTEKGRGPVGLEPETPEATQRQGKTRRRAA